MSVESVLKRYFGYDAFRSRQREIIECVLGGGNGLVLMPTGGGKSICYQVPALVLPGLTVVVSPLISLMKDQVETLCGNGIPARALNSASSELENSIVRRECFEGQIKLLYISPERLMMELPILAQHVTISLFAIDEAHCISNWGHDFRPEYCQLGVLREQFPKVPILALTATADKVTRLDILRQLHIDDAQQFISDFDRPNLNLDVRRGLDAREKRNDILRFLIYHRDDPGIIYCLSRKNAEDVAQFLRMHHFSATVYHAGLGVEERDKAQEDFLNDRVQIVCATIAFGMGINKSNVRFVIHYNMPKSIENFYQEIGRAGRDGLESDTILFYSAGDIAQLEHFARESGQQEINMERLARMKEYAQSDVCRRRILLNYFGQETTCDCGHCDVCRNPPQHFDGTQLVQMALSAICRAEEHITMRTCADILCGFYTPEVKEHGFFHLKTFSVGSHIPVRDWNDYLLQMLHLGYVEIKYDEHNHLHVTDAGMRVVHGNATALLVQPRPLEETFAERKKRRKNLREVLQSRFALQFGGELDELTENEQLFEALRKLRRSLAEEQHCPPYQIFSDKVLHSIAQQMPTDVESFGRISGVGEFKRMKYAARFLEIVSQYQ